MEAWLHWAASTLSEIPVGSKGSTEPHALLCWGTKRELQPTGGTAVMGAKVEGHVESQEALWDNRDNQPEHLHNRIHQINRKEGEGRILNLI